MINRTTVLAHTGNTDSQMLCWTDTIHSADGQSYENYRQPYICKNIKVVVPRNTPLVGILLEYFLVSLLHTILAFRHICYVIETYGWNVQMILKE